MLPIPHDRRSPAHPSRRQSGLRRLTAALALSSALLGALVGPAAADEPVARIHLPLALRGIRMADLPGMPTPVPPTATATPLPPTETPTPPPPTATPTATATAPPSATPLKPLPAALVEANRHRALAGLGPVTENEVWSRGGELHARYMVKNDEVGHSEDPTKPFYSAEGLDAAKNGNVFVSSMASTDSRVPVNFWMTGTFHMVAVLDPELTVSGFGEYREAGSGWAYGATLEVGRGRKKLPDGFRFPVRYPEEGETLPNLSFGGNEFPDPLTSCPGYKAPTGAPIVLMIGAGDRKPAVSFSALVDGEGSQYPHCLLDETRYVNPNSGTQSTGRVVLDSRDAIVLLPRAPLKAGLQYRVTIVEGGTTHSWSFRTAGGLLAQSAWRRLERAGLALMGGG
ncbi:MAG: CAP domain-containing protein [Anaerolineae bacterium]